MEKKRFVGTYNNIYDLLDKYPNGGLTGDYAIVSDEEFYWSDIRNDWISSILINPGKPVRDIYGDVVFRDDVVVVGELRALNFSPADKGLYKTVEELKESHPLGRKGDWALVGKCSPFSIYRHNGYHWEDTGEKESLGENPLRLFIETDGDNFLCYGESLTLTCKVYRGMDEVTQKSMFKITRDSGNDADDAVWNFTQKAKEFQRSGIITLCINENEDDLGSSNNNSSACFTITATIEGDLRTLGAHLFI